MPDMEKVIKGLEICTKDIPMSNAVHKSDLCKECPYYNAEYSYCLNQTVMMHDALVLLKEQDCKCCGTVFDVAYKAGKADAVVRCKDCRYSTIMATGNMVKCRGIERMPNWFCADGEARS